MASALPEPDLSAGVSRTLAIERAARVSGLRYALTFTVPAKPHDVVRARAVITFSLRDTATPLVLDFEPNARGRLHTLSTEAGPLAPAVDDGHIALPVHALRPGANTVTVELDAGDAPLNRNDDFLYTLFVPARAREVFPCFDQPDLKACWTLTLDLPCGWEAVANEGETSRRPYGDRHVISFDETPLLPTYLFAFAAGRFRIEDAERRGRPFRVFHRESDAVTIARNCGTLVDLHAASLSWLEDYTDSPYPFSKFDVVLIPSFQFGGMEHPGAIYYNAASMLLEASATEQQLLMRASTIAHETAHMWFGDLVTMGWFTDVWMKEVFANFLAAKIVNPLFPAIDHDLRFLLAHYPASYDVDRTAGANAIRQDLDNLKDAGTLYGPIIYLKSPIVMRQLEMMLGHEVLRDVLRVYLRTYRFSNASWPDLMTIVAARLDPASAAELDSWSRAWVDAPGRPVIRTELIVAEGTVARLTLTQEDSDASRGLTWTQDVRVALGYDDRVETVPVRLSGARRDVAEARGWEAPRFVLPNGGGIAYGEIRVDPASLSWLSTNLPAIGDPLTRASAWITLWDALLAGDVRASTWLDLAVGALLRETSEITVQYILQSLERAFWKFTPEHERRARALEVERALAGGIARAGTTSLKSAYFNTLRHVAQTEAVCWWLARVWRGEISIPGLPLSDVDRVLLAQDLAVREVPGWSGLLGEQVARTAHPDRRERLRFILPALSADSAERERFFTSLADVANRRHEAWVLDGVRYLHHPLRAASAVRFLEPALDLLLEIQQTGDIFFPKRWMDATLSGHRSKQAEGIVRAFLERMPATYPDRLRRIILASADDLFRACRLG